MTEQRPLKFHNTCGDTLVMNKNSYRFDLVKDYLNRINLNKEIIEFYNGKNILVTGGAGGIGSNLVQALSIINPKGKIIVLDNLSAIKDKNSWNVPANPNILFVEGDVRNDKHLKRVFKEGVDLVFHLAAFFANQNSVDYTEDSADVDVIGMIKLLEISNLCNVERFIYASSGCAIYGSFPELPLKEDFISMHLTTPYQINKMTGEMYCNFYKHHYDLNIVNCRFFNSFGPGEVPGQYRNVIPNFIYWSMKGFNLPITGDGSETRDFTYVLDLVQGLIKSGYYKDAIGENFNLAAGKEISILDMANKVREVTNNTNDLLYLERRKWDTKPRLLASIDKANKLIDYNPIVDFEEGFQKNLEWFNLFEEEIANSSDFPPGMSSAVRK